MAAGLRTVAGLADPSGRSWTAACVRTGCASERVRVPLGVVGVIYENRPNVTSDSAGLCLKAGNATMLRGSSSALAVEQGRGLVLARRPLEGRPSRGRSGPRRADRPRIGGRVHAPRRRSRLSHPPRRAVAHRIGARERDGSDSDRRRRQLPCLRGSGPRTSTWPRRRRQREDLTARRVQRGRVAARPRRRGRGVPADGCARRCPRSSSSATSERS